MYKYETHMHTSPVSGCAHASVRESIECYKNLGYDGVFITNHFIDGNLAIDRSAPYEEKIEFFFSACEEGKKIGEELGIKVFSGLEQGYLGSDFLVYGLDKEWFLKNPQIQQMSKREELEFYIASGALVIHAHPFREDSYIDHIRLFPRSVHGVEVYNANRRELENRMAKLYAENYGLIEFAGSDNHDAGRQKKLGGMCSETPVTDEQDFVRRVLNGEMKIFTLERD